MQIKYREQANIPNVYWFFLLGDIILSVQLNHCHFEMSLIKEQKTETQEK